MCYHYLLQINAHQDDVSSVKFADESGNVIFSGGDDGVVKVWDRRSLRESNPQPVGIFAGHKDGITFIDSKVGSYSSSSQYYYHTYY